MSWFANRSIKSKIGLLVGAFALSTLVLTAGFWTTLSEVKINGGRYHRIILAKDLVADILSAARIRHRGVPRQPADEDETDPERLRGLVDRGPGCVRTMKKRHRFWMSQTLDSDIKRSFLDDSYRFAIKFFDTRDQRFVPAVVAAATRRPTPSPTAICGAATTNTWSTSTRPSSSPPPRWRARRRMPSTWSASPPPHAGAGSAGALPP